MVNSLMRNGKFLIILIILIVSLLVPWTVFAQKTLVVDEANLMSPDQVLDLNDRANALSQEFNMDIVIVTTDDTGGKSSREFADDYFDYNGYGVGPNYDGILFLIDMDNRETYISTTGQGIRFLTDVRIEAVLDRVFDSGLLVGDYYGAALGFLEETESYLVMGIPSGQYNEPEEVVKENKLTVADILIALIGALGVGLAFIISIISQYRFRSKPNPYSYRTNSIVNFYNRQDRLINSFVTHRVIPKPTNPSKSTLGRSTTHRSSSGRTHGGGGRKF